MAGIMESNTVHLLSSTFSRDFGDSDCLGGNGSLGACSRSGFIFTELEFWVANIRKARWRRAVKRKVQLSMCEALRGCVITTNPKRLHII